MEKKPKSKLNPKQEKFARLYATDTEFFGNGVQSYIDVYQPKRVGNWYNNARSAASELLTNPNVLARINELLDASGLNDAHVDKQLYQVLTQSADLKAKIAAVKEYNALKRRVVKRVSVEVTDEDRDLIEKLFSENAD